MSSNYSLQNTSQISIFNINDYNSKSSDDDASSHTSGSTKIENQNKEPHNTLLNSTLTENTPKTKRQNYILKSFLLKNKSFENEKNEDSPLHNSPKIINLTENYFFDKNKIPIDENQTLSYISYPSTQLEPKEFQSQYLSTTHQELITKISSLVNNQYNCSYVEKYIDRNPSIIPIIVYPAIKPYIYSLSLDPFGNYLIQKVIDNLTNPQLIEAFQSLLTKSELVMLCKSLHGSRVMEKLLEKTYQNYNLIAFFTTNFLISNINELIVDQNSTHIIIKFFQLITENSNNMNENKQNYSNLLELLVDYLNKNIYFLSTNKHSCCTLQKCIQILDENGMKKETKSILLNIAKLANLLFNHIYGNYIVQFALGFEDIEVNNIIVGMYFSNFIGLSTEKCSSNIFWKIVIHCGVEIRKWVVRNFCKIDVVTNLLLGKYGNYVLQQIIQIAFEPYKSEYLKMVASIIDQLNYLSYGKNIMTNLIKYFPEIMNYRNLLYSNNSNNHISKFNFSINETDNQ